jgi:hypothetical protein
MSEDSYRIEVTPEFNPELFWAYGSIEAVLSENCYLVRVSDLQLRDLGKQPGIIVMKPAKPKRQEPGPILV